MDASAFDWKKYLNEALSATNYFCIATVDKKGVWSNPVYFAWDNRYNFYFISQMESRHMQNIANNSRVSVSIYITEQKGDVIGVQLEGEASILKVEEDKKKAHIIYYDRVGSLEQNEFAMHDPKWLFVKITPEQIYYFDSKIFGEERQTVPMNKI